MIASAQRNTNVIGMRVITGLAVAARPPVIGEEPACRECPGTGGRVWLLMAVCRNGAFIQRLRCPNQRLPSVTGASSQVVTGRSPTSKPCKARRKPRSASSVTFQASQSGQGAKGGIHGAKMVGSMCPERGEFWPHGRGGVAVAARPGFTISNKLHTRGEAFGEVAVPVIVDGEASAWKTPCSARIGRSGRLRGAYLPGFRESILRRHRPRDCSPRARASATLTRARLWCAARHPGHTAHDGHVHEPTVRARRGSSKSASSSTKITSEPRPWIVKRVNSPTQLIDDACLTIKRDHHGVDGQRRLRVTRRNGAWTGA